jgi:hypothetical protein
MAKNMRLGQFFKRTGGECLATAPRFRLAYGMTATDRFTQ